MEQLIADLSASVTTNYTDGDYKDCDGLLRCGKCDTRKQYRIARTFSGKRLDRVVNCLCKCAVDEHESLLAAQRNQDYYRKVRANRNIGFPAQTYCKWTFANDDGANPNITEEVRTYADAFDPDCSLGLLLCGGLGTGKTYLSACIANALMGKGRKVIMTNVKRISNVVNASFETRQFEHDRLINCDLLILDDMGTERHTEFMIEQMFEVVDGRYKAEKPMIVSTNLTPEQMEMETQLGLKRIYDRILERSYVIRFNGRDRRKGSADANELRFLRMQENI